MDEADDWKLEGRGGNKTGGVKLQLGWQMGRSGSRDIKLMVCRLWRPNDAVITSGRWMAPSDRRGENMRGGDSPEAKRV